MKHRNFLAPLMLSACLVFGASCGSDDDNSNDPVQQEQAGESGTFTATLNPVNPGIGGNAASGTVVFTIEEASTDSGTTSGASSALQSDRFIVRAEVSGVPARITHLQHVHAGSACPTLAQDSNADGFVDVIEGVASYGPILIPLDTNLSSQAAGMLTGPFANAAGQYIYNRQAIFSTLLQDLQKEDSDMTDAVVKLPAGSPLNLEGRTVIIHGVPKSVSLPQTVASLKGIPAYKTLPIACGVIIRGPADGGTTTGGTTTGGTTTGGTTTGTTTGGTTTGTTTGGTTTGG